MKLTLELLQHQPLLEHLNEKDLKGLLPHLHLLEVNKGQTLISQGEMSKGIYVVVQGRFKVMSFDMEHKEQGFVYLTPKQFFGELSVVDKVPSTVSVIATVKCWVILIPSKYAQVLLDESPAIARDVMRKLARALRSANEKIMMLNTKSHWRVFYFLRSIGHLNAHDQIVGELPTHEDIASMTNLTRETVSRSVAKLKKMGLLDVSRSPGQRLFVLKSALPV